MSPELLIPIRLSKEGYGTPDQIRQMPTDLVMATVRFSGFLADYEATYIELNKENSSK